MRCWTLECLARCWLRQEEVIGCVWGQTVGIVEVFHISKPSSDDGQPAPEKVSVYIFTYSSSPSFLSSLIHVSFFLKFFFSSSFQ